MVKGLLALPGGLNSQQQTITNLLLPYKIIKPGRSQSVVKGGVALIEDLCRVGLHVLG